MWFQRLIEIDDDCEPELVSEPTEGIMPIKGSGRLRVKSTKTPISTPADFQRVRMMSTISVVANFMDGGRQPEIARKAGEQSLSIDLTLPTHEDQSGSSSFPANDEPSATEPTEEVYLIKCICGRPEDDGNTVYCETCDTWQHIECYYPNEREAVMRQILTMNVLTADRDR